jgi:serine protease inhibitor
VRPSSVMISRRNVLALAGVAGVAGLAGCGNGLGSEGTMSLIRSELTRAPERATARAAAVAAVSAFSAEVFAAVTGSSAANLVCSPYSVAVALGMAVQGAHGATARQILHVLHGDQSAALADGLNSIDLTLAGRSGAVPGTDDKDKRVELTFASSLWGQRDVSWSRPFLDVLAKDFGTGMRVVDYAEAEAARSAINAWVSQQTRGRIKKLVPAGVLSVDTHLVLANALYFKAPWQTPFKIRRTREAPFHRLDSSTADAKLMTGVGTRYARGPGWVAVDLPYARRQLAMTVVVPDTGQFTAVQAGVTGDWLTDLLTALEPAPIEVSLPRWTSRSQLDLKDALADLGMPLAFADGADFTRMSAQVSLKLSAVLHEGFIAVDEAGTEAAAATGVVAETTSLFIPGRSVVADRPFLYVIHDVPTRTPLFLGRVLDPTAT